MTNPVEASKEDEASKKEKAMVRKAAKQRRQQQLQQERNEQFKQAQRYLGLRPSEPGAPPPVDTSQRIQLPFDKDVVFVCIDIESYERRHSKILEIGIASLDTRHLRDRPPGADAEHWRFNILARHFIIEDHMHYVNHEFVHGCPDRFEFGKSQVVRLVDAPAAVKACFAPPFAGSTDDGYNLHEKRNIVFVAHNAKADLDYLNRIGFDALSHPRTLGFLDSEVLYRVWKRENQSKSLSGVLGDFGILAWNLHNAGNDAVYTLQALLAVCVRESSIRGAVGGDAQPEPEKERDENELGDDFVI